MLISRSTFRPSSRRYETRTDWPESRLHLAHPSFREKRVLSFQTKVKGAVPCLDLSVMVWLEQSISWSGTLTTVSVHLAQAIGL